LGLALAERRLVEDDLASGRLVAPFGFVSVPDGFQAAVLGNSISPACANFLDWLCAEAGG